MDVFINLTVMGIISLDQIEGVVYIGAIFRMGWVDPRLSWDPAQYNNLQYISVRNLDHERKMYVPEVRCFESVGGWEELSFFA